MILALMGGCTYVKTPQVSVLSVGQNALVNSATASGEWSTVLVSPSALDDDWNVRMRDDAGLVIESEKSVAEGKKVSMWSALFGGLLGFITRGAL